jgi:site-specific DNA-cytosine methylase
MFTHISLFSGIGCSDIAAEWAGFETVLMCEIDKDCQKVLKKHWPTIPIIEDVKDVKRESVRSGFTSNPSEVDDGRLTAESIKRQIQELRDSFEPDTSSNTECSTVTSKIKEWQECIINNGREIRNFSPSSDRTNLTLLTAGVPCQPASSAGKRRGKADDRWLWPEAIRVLGELQPTWAVFENPTGIASLVESGETIQVGSETDQTSDSVLSVELSNIIANIEKEGYEVQPVSISAASVGAPHKRQRIFIVAHSQGDGRTEPTGNSRADGLSTELGSYPGWQQNWIEVAQRLCSKTQSGVRSVDARATTGLLGLSRVSKLKMLGNCNPPQLYYLIYKAIYDIEANQ